MRRWFVGATLRRLEPRGIFFSLLKFAFACFIFFANLEIESINFCERNEHRMSNFFFVVIFRFKPFISKSKYQSKMAPRMKDAAWAYAEMVDDQMHFKFCK